MSQATTAPPSDQAAATTGIASRGRVAQAWIWMVRFARRKPLGAAAAVLAVALIGVAVFAPIIATHDPKDFVGNPFEQPAFSDSWSDWGTDRMGRDVFSRVVWGARISLYVGLLATFWGTTVGLVWGLAQGYLGGTWFDTISQRLVEAMLSVPGLILALTFLAVLGPSVNNVILAIGINYIPSAARTIRSTTLSIREHMYVDAARAMGAPARRIIFRHIMPNTLSIYLILVSLHVGGAIIAEASLSFLGVGVPPDTPTWGGMITQGTQEALYSRVPWLAIFPGMAIAAVVYAFNLLGDALRDTLDPRLQRR